MAVTASISLTENSYSVANNTSSVTCKVTVSWTYGSWDHTGKTKTLTFNGTKYTTTANINPNRTTSGSQTLFNKTVTVTHNSDGSKTVNASVSIPTGTSSGTVTASKSLTLTNIPRYATVTQTLLSKTETTIKIKWASDSTVDYIWYSSNDGSSWTGINVTDGKSGEYTISGLVPRTTYKIKTRVRRKESQLTTDSSALSVATYSYPYANSMPNFTIGNKLTIGIFNPLKRSVTVNIIGEDDSQISNDTTTGTSITGYAGDGVVNRLYASIPDKRSGQYRVKVTYGNHVMTNTGGHYIINTSDCSPSIGSVSYRDVNSAVTAITGNNQNIVRNKSTVEYTASGLTAQKSATIASCKVTVNGNTYNLTLSGSSATGGNAVINSGSNVTAKFTMTDSRGLTATKSVTVHMLDLQSPTAIVSIARRNNFYSETDINVDADYSSVDGKNTISITYKAKKKGTSSWTVTGTLQDDVTALVTIDNNYAWDFQITLTDRFGGTKSYNASVPRGMPIIFFDRLKSSVGVNCFPKDEESLEVNGVNVSRSIMTRSLSANLTNLAETTYTIIPLDLSNSVGNKLTATDDGGIEIGANVSKILVSARASIAGSSQTGRRHLRIMKNSYTNNNTIAWSQDDFGASVTEDIVITPTLGDVQEGDVIYLWYYVPNSADSLGGNAYGARTSMTVEVVG